LRKPEPLSSSTLHAFRTILGFRVRQQIFPANQTAHYPVDVVLDDGLQDNAAKLVLQSLDRGPGLNPMLAAKLGRNYKLPLGRKCSS